MMILSPVMIKNAILSRTGVKMLSIITGHVDGIFDIICTSDTFPGLVPCLY